MNITLGFKIRGLSRMLALRGAISNEEAETMGIVYFFKKEGEVKELQEQTLELIEGEFQSGNLNRESTPEERRVYVKILYQPNFLEEVRRKYEDYIEPFARRASWIYITKKLAETLNQSKK